MCWCIFSRNDASTLNYGVCVASSNLTPFKHNTGKFMICHSPTSYATHSAGNCVTCYFCQKYTFDTDNRITLTKFLIFHKPIRHHCVFFKKLKATNEAHNLQQEVMTVPILWKQGFGIPRISAVILYCCGTNRLGIYVEQLEMAELFLLSLKTMFFKPWIPGIFLYYPRNGQMIIFWKFVGICFAVKSICLTIPLNGLCCTISKHVCLQYGQIYIYIDKDKWINNGNGCQLYEFGSEYSPQN